MANEVTIHVKAKDDASKTMDSVGARSKATFKGLAVGAGVAALAVGAKLFQAMGKASVAAREANKIHAQTGAVLRSTSHAANVSGKEIDRLTSSLSRKTGIDDEVIRSGANMLLTFTKVRNEAGKGKDIFNQTLPVLNDMSVALGQDMKSSAIQVGKALSDPIKGVTALKRVGVTFNEEQQKTIKHLVNTGKTAEAQRVILAELRKEFGGSAKAQGTWADKAKVAAGNIQESFGDLVNKGLEPVAKWFAQTGAPAIEGFFDKISKNKDLKRALDNLKTTLEDLGALDLAGMFEDLNEQLPQAVDDLNAVVKAIGKLQKANAKLTEGQGGGLREAGDEWVRLKAKALGAMDDIASAGAKLGIVPKKFADQVHDMRVKADVDLKGVEKRFRESKVEVRLRADKKDAQAKIADIDRRLKKTNDAKVITQLKADKKNAQARINEINRSLNALDGKVATSKINIVTRRTTIVQRKTIGSGHDPGYAQGGIIGAQGANRAAGGGPRSNQVLVGEQGPEIVDLPMGSHVNSNPDSRRMMANSGRGDITINVMAPNYVGTPSDLLKALVDAKRRGQLDVILR